MSKKLTREDLAFISESLAFTRSRFEAYAYPSYELRQERLREADAVIAKVNALWRAKRFPKTTKRGNA